MSLYIGNEKVNAFGGLPVIKVLETTDATVTPDKLLEGETAYGANGKIDGAIPVKAAQTYTPGAESQIISAGQYLGGDQVIEAVITETKTVTPKATAQTITPSEGKYLSQVTVNGDSDLVAANIKSGVNIFGVTGTLEAGLPTGIMSTFTAICSVAQSEIILDFHDLSMSSEVYGMLTQGPGVLGGIQALQIFRSDVVIDRDPNLINNYGRSIINDLLIVADLNGSGGDWFRTAMCSTDGSFVEGYVLTDNPFVNCRFSGSQLIITLIDQSVCFNEAGVYMGTIYFTNTLA